jgi:thrombospondin type 3 repeat protein
MKSLKILITALFAVLLLALPATALASGRQHHKARDRNHDGIPDRWEKRFHLSLKVNQARKDPDHDGLNNKQEFQDKTNPRAADTDNDGLKDGAEVEMGDNPNNPDTNGDGVEDGDEIRGTVQSFDSSTGLLTILLPDGQTTKSGTVTSSTEIRCDGEHGDMHAADNGDSQSGDSQDSGESSGEGDSGGADEQDQQSCGTANLVPGAVVDEAELDDSGQTFTKVKLVPSA